MNKKEHDEAVTSLKEICKDIGCSGLNPDMCDHAPQKCGIIRKLVMSANDAERKETICEHGVNLKYYICAACGNY